MSSKDQANHINHIAYEIYKRNKEKAAIERSKEEWDLFKTLENNIKTFEEFIHLLNYSDKALKKLSSIDLKSQEEYKNISGVIHKFILNKMPCFGALESHLNMAAYTLQPNSFRDRVMITLDVLKGKADTIQSEHKAIKSSKEGAAVISALEKVSEKITHMKEFLEVQVRIVNVANI